MVESCLEKLSLGNITFPLTDVIPKSAVQSNYYNYFHSNDCESQKTNKNKFPSASLKPLLSQTGPGG